MHVFRSIALGISPILLLFSLSPPHLAAQSAPEQAAPTVNAEEFRTAVLGNMMRHPPAYRDGDKKRLMWEWWDTVARNYLFEKNMLLWELSDGSPYRLRPEWVFRGISVTFQDIFELPETDDETLVPIISMNAIVSNAPNSTFAGLPIYGKQGELKGTIIRKYAVSTADYGRSVWTGVGAGSESQWSFVHVLEYRNEDGEREIARGNSWDSFNLLWKDIKGRVADVMSPEKELEDRDLFRDAFSSSLTASFADR